MQRSNNVLTSALLAVAGFGVTGCDQSTAYQKCAHIDWRTLEVARHADCVKIPNSKLRASCQRELSNMRNAAATACMMVETNADTLCKITGTTGASMECIPAPTNADTLCKTTGNFMECIPKAARPAPPRRDLTPSAN